jgi:hypothetical protein
LAISDKQYTALEKGQKKLKTEIDINDNCSHIGGCGCTPFLFMGMIENAGIELSQRKFVKGAGAVVGMLAFGSLASPAIGYAKTVDRDSQADAIYHGGPIVTMTQEGERVEALAVQNGCIMAVGKLGEVLALKGSNTKLIDLGGKTLMPGFIDPHSPVAMQSAKFATANLDPKPIGEAGSIADIQRSQYHGKLFHQTTLLTTSLPKSLNLTGDLKNETF